jgi:hypothetical protein
LDLDISNLFVRSLSERKTRMMCFGLDISHVEEDRGADLVLEEF